MRLLKFTCSANLRLPLAFLCLSLLTSEACSAEKPGELKVALFNLPWGFFSSGSSSAEGKLDVPSDGIKLIKSPLFYPETEVYDARKYLRDVVGVSISQEGQAFYLKDARILYVKDTVENLDLIKSLRSEDNAGPPAVLRNEIFIVELSPNPRLPDRPAPTLSELRKAAGKSWKQISALEIISKSGHFNEAAFAAGTTLSRPFKQDGRASAPELAATDSGASAAVESVVGPDFYTIDSTVSFHYQNLQGKKPLSLTFSGETTLENALPQLLQYIAGAPNEPSYAIIERVTLAKPDSSPLPSIKNTRADPTKKSSP